MPSLFLIHFREEGLMLEHTCAELRGQLAVLSFYHVGPGVKLRSSGLAHLCLLRQFAGFLHAFFMTLTWKREISVLQNCTYSKLEAYGSQKRVQVPLEPKLWTIVRCHVCSGHWTGVLCKSGWYS